MSFFFYKYVLNHFHEAAHKYSPPSCYHYIVLYTGVQRSAVYSGESTGAAPLCTHPRFRQYIKMNIKGTDFKRYPTAYCAIVFHQSLRQLHIVFVTVIAQESRITCKLLSPS